MLLRSLSAQAHCSRQVLSWPRLPGCLSRRRFTALAALTLAWSLVASGALADEQQATADGPADLILTGGKILTVDNNFTIASAMAIRGERIVAVGSDEQINRLAGPNTRRIDLGGKTVLPGLIDSHTHPTGASMYEFDHPIPAMESIEDVLNYVRARAKVLPEGSWITMRQVFITRLKEQRYPTKAELDAAAPNHPVVFSTGPDASVNSLALKLSGIDKDFQVVGTGKIERDENGEPTGILRSAGRFLKVKSAERSPTEADRLNRLKLLFADYNSVGITGAIDRNSGESALALYHKLLKNDELSVRLAVSYGVNGQGKIEANRERLAEIAAHPLRAKNPRLRIVGVKTFLDGGMLTGSAYMRQPWGISQIYSISDPRYQGVLNIPREQLLPLVEATIDNGLQFTAHSVGDGAVHLLLDVYNEIAQKKPIKHTRPCLTHSNFMSAEAVEQAAKLGVVLDIQPAWLYLDSHTLEAQFGYDRLRYFQPLQTIFKTGGIVGGGSDHMQRIDSLKSINPYNPFLGMWVAITRRGKWYDGQLHPEEALSRQQALQFYTRNNAHLMFLEDEIGTLEVGKRADFVVIDRDFLECPIDDLKDTQVLSTWIDGKPVYERKP